MGFSKSKQSSNNESQQTSVSNNQAYPFLRDSLSSQVGNVGAGSNAIASLLGLNGSDEGINAFNRFKDSSGYDFVENEGVKSITNNRATRGLLGSGSAMKEIARYSTGLANNFLNSYLSNLSGLSNTGIQAGQILASAGNTANSQGTSFGSSKGSSIGASLG